MSGINTGILLNNLILLGNLYKTEIKHHFKTALLFFFYFGSIIYFFIENKILKLDRLIWIGFFS